MSDLKKFFYKSPFSWLEIVVSEKGLKDLKYVRKEARNSGESLSALAQDILKQLDEYFAGKRTVFKMPLDLENTGTEFQKRTWQELSKIPYGQTISYAELASRVGKPKASRAVGNANGKNPIPIIIPCHRVVKSDGSLGGYTSGIEKKKWLLSHELGQ